MIFPDVSRHKATIFPGIFHSATFFAAVLFSLRRGFWPMARSVNDCAREPMGAQGFPSRTGDPGTRFAIKR